jgi:hypothetical protein
MDPDADADPIFVIKLQEANKKLIVFVKFFCLLLFEGIYLFSSLFKIKGPKEVTKQ